LKKILLKVFEKELKLGNFLKEVLEDPGYDDAKILAEEAKKSLSLYIP